MRFSENKNQKNETYKRNWFSDTDFWINYGPLMFNSQSWEDAFFDIKHLMKLESMKSGQMILDSCCGVGRHSLELAKAGMKVSGVDITQPYINAAQETAVDMNLDIKFFCDDVRKFKKNNLYDFVVNLYTSYGYFESEDDEKLYLANVLQSLKPGGRFIIDTMSKEALARDFIEDQWFEEDEQLICLGFEVIENFSRLVNRWMIISQDGTRKDYKFSHKLYSAIEIKWLLEQAGFCNIEIYGSLAGDKYDHNVKRLVVSAQKSDKYHI